METMFIPHSDYLEHHGILGQKWGIRRYQNKDGSYTKAGRDRYRSLSSSEVAETERLIKSDPVIGKASADRRKAAKLLIEYDNLSESKKDKYIRQASDNAWKKYGNPDDQSDRENFYYAYKYDDLDQGYESSFQFFLKDKGASYADVTRKVSDANKKWSSIVSKRLDEIYNEYSKPGAKVDPGYKNIKLDELENEAFYKDSLWLMWM